MKLTKLPSQVWTLGLVSLFTDVASEMLYPVTPIFLAATLGSSMALIGMVEGIAEITAGLLKGYFGLLSDRLGKRALFIKAGYGLSALVKPLPGLFPVFSSVLFSRVTDRIGKGIRTAPRDALLASYADGNTGRVFGFHRSMDTLGAALGPVLALLYLNYYPGNYRMVFLLAFIPSALAVASTLILKDRSLQVKKSRGRRNYPLLWKEAPREYKTLLLLLTLFSLVNSSDVFLILKSRSIARSDFLAIAGYIFYNIVYALSSYPAGIISDRWGKKKVYTAGLLLFSVVYLGFALTESQWVIWLLFMLYGLYAAFTEGISRAWVSDLVGENLRASALGLLSMSGSIALMTGSVLTGLLWDHFGPALPFLISSFSGILLAVLLYIFTVKNQ